MKYLRKFNQKVNEGSRENIVDKLKSLDYSKLEKEDMSNVSNKEIEEASLEEVDGSEIDHNNKTTSNMKILALYSKDQIIGVISFAKESLRRTPKNTITNVFSHPGLKNRGIGTKLYISANNYLIKNNEGVLKSDFDITPEAIGLWNSLVKKGLAKKIGKADNGNPLFEMINPNEKDTVEKIDEGKLINLVTALGLTISSIFGTAQAQDVSKSSQSTEMDQNVDKSFEVKGEGISSDMEMAEKEAKMDAVGKIGKKIDKLSSHLYNQTSESKFYKTEDGKFKCVVTMVVTIN